MIIYALIISAALFFLAWNLIEKPKIHFIASLVTTLLFLITVFFAVANFNDHYGMHRVNEPAKTQRIMSTSPQHSLKMLIYRPMGTTRNSQLIIYKNNHNRIIHTVPDSKVTNQIVHNNQVTNPHLVTRASKWEYRSAMDRFWFNMAKKPSTYRIHHVFYIPNSWRILSVKQTLALKQIIKNRSQQLKQEANSPKAKRQIHHHALMYVKAQEMKAFQKNPKLSDKQKNLIGKRAVASFKSKMKQKTEHKLIDEALQTTKSID